MNDNYSIKKLLLECAHPGTSLESPSPRGPTGIVSVQSLSRVQLFVTP